MVNKFMSLQTSWKLRLNLGSFYQFVTSMCARSPTLWHFSAFGLRTMFSIPVLSWTRRPGIVGVVVSSGVGWKTCSLELVSEVLLIGHRKMCRRPKAMYLKERKGDTIQGVIHRVCPLLSSPSSNSEQLPIGRFPCCMGPVVKKVWKRTVVVSRVVGVPTSTNHELTHPVNDMTKVQSLGNLLFEVTCTLKFVYYESIKRELYRRHIWVSVWWKTKN
jgi:hypothetical protein